MTSTTQPSAIPQTMRAWVRQRRGPASSALELVADLPTPARPTGSSADVLIRVSHVALQFNSGVAMTVMPSLPWLTGPWIPELELAGEVVAAGAGAPAVLRDKAARTKVVAFQTVPTALLLGHGVLAEYVRLPADQVTYIDAAAHVDPAEVAGLHCCGAVALKMLRWAGARAGQTVLVNGASGSIGSVFVQLSKLRGIRVVAVASGGNEALVRGLGAEEFIDYRAHDPLPAYLAQTYGHRPFDFVFDCVGSQALYTQSPAYLKPEGAVVNVGAMQDNLAVSALNVLRNLWLPVWLGGVPRRYITIGAMPNHDDAVYLTRLVEDGKLRIPVDSVFAMEDARSAFARVATKRARGKVVIKVQGD